MKKKARDAAEGDFEYCKVCDRHHQDGNRHKYFPRHLKSLSSFLAKFQSKLSDVLFFLKNPTILPPQHASRNRLWCVFCDIDIDEVGSSFACTNAIRHLSSDSHLKSLKRFLWKNGGAMDQADSFTIPKTELAKWERKCVSIQKGDKPAGEVFKGATTYGPSNDIHNQTDSVGINSLDNYTMSTHGSNNPNGVVMPLHRYTNENSQVLASQMDEYVRPEFGYQKNGVYSSIQPVMQLNSSPAGSTRHADCQPLRQFPGVSEEAEGNVHTGAPPPWLEPIDSQDNVRNGSGYLVKSSQRSAKSCKLNPKRVGAAWAEKRKLEMEMEKRGELSAENDGDSWLPNFGRVWQAGSRKKSKKEFEMEKKKVSEVVSQPEFPIEIQPYVSKRMRTDGTSIG